MPRKDGGLCRRIILHLGDETVAGREFEDSAFSLAKIEPRLGRQTTVGVETLPRHRPHVDEGHGQVRPDFAHRFDRQRPRGSEKLFCWAVGHCPASSSRAERSATAATNLEPAIWSSVISTSVNPALSFRSCLISVSQMRTLPVADASGRATGCDGAIDGALAMIGSGAFVRSRW